MLRGICAWLLAIGSLSCASIAGLADYDEAGTTGAGGDGGTGNSGGAASGGSGGDGGFTVQALPVSWPLQPVLAVDSASAFVAQADPGTGGMRHVVLVDLATGAATELVDSRARALRLVLHDNLLLWVANSGGFATSHQLWQAATNGMGSTFEATSQDQTIGGLSPTGLYSVNGGAMAPTTNVYEHQPGGTMNDVAQATPPPPEPLGITAANGKGVYVVAGPQDELFQIANDTASALGPSKVSALDADGNGVVWMLASGGLFWRRNNDDEIVDVAKGLGIVEDIALSGSHIYWTERSAGAVYRVARDGSAAPVLLADNQSNAAAIQLEGTRAYWVVTSSGDGEVRYIDFAPE